MGRSITPKFRIEARDQTGWHNYTYSVKNYGIPTEENIKKWIAIHNDAFKEGGVNEHISNMYGYDIEISHVMVIDNINHTTYLEVVCH